MKQWLPAGAFLVLTAAVLAAPEPSGRSEITALLGRIQKVGREGAGNVEAAKAWKALVARGEPALLPILSAMNDDDPTAANWLRPAFEAIAEHILQDGKSLPKVKLEKFLTQHEQPRFRPAARLRMAGEDRQDHARPLPARHAARPQPRTAPRRRGARHRPGAGAAREEGREGREAGVPAGPHRRVRSGPGGRHQPRRSASSA